MDLSFPLAAEAPLGEYSIRMPGLTRTFRVEEYGKSLRKLVAAEKGVLPASSALHKQSWMGHAAVNSCAGCAVSWEVQLPARRYNHLPSPRPTGFLLPHILQMGLRQCPTAVL